MRTTFSMELGMGFRSQIGSLNVCKELGVTVALEKCAGPTVCIVFLGIELNSENVEMRLPRDKLDWLRETIKHWRGCKGCSKQEPLSLIGQLSHACKVVRPGRIFLSQMIKLSTVPKQLHHHVRLNHSFRRDLEWWHLFLESWNGISLLWNSEHPSLVVTSDASGRWGCGAFCNTHWFQLKWPESLPNYHITVKELIPVVIAAAIWGAKLEYSHVRVRSNNSAVVAIINGGYSRDADVMHLMRCLHFLSARRAFRLSAEHIKGSHSEAADALSRDSLSFFQTIHPYPVTEDTLCYLCAFLADEGLTHQTIKCYLSAVRHQHVSQGFADPHISDMARLELLLRGIKIVRA